MGICFSHHLHREASCVGLHLVLEAWEARGEDSTRAGINRVSTGMMLAWRRGNEQWAKGEEILSDSKDHKNELEVDRATLRHKQKGFLKVFVKIFAKCLQYLQL